MYHTALWRHTYTWNSKCFSYMNTSVFISRINFPQCWFTQVVDQCCSIWWRCIVYWSIPLRKNSQQAVSGAIWQDMGDMKRNSSKISHFSLYLERLVSLGFLSILDQHEPSTNRHLVFEFTEHPMHLASWDICFWWVQQELHRLYRYYHIKKQCKCTVCLNTIMY